MWHNSCQIKGLFCNGSWFPPNLESRVLKRKPSYLMLWIPHQSNCRLKNRYAGQVETGYVLKQLRSFNEAPEQLRLSFAREAYFGQLINSLPATQENCNLHEDSDCQDGRQHLVRFIESFEVSCCKKFALKLSFLVSCLEGELADCCAICLLPVMENCILSWHWPMWIVRRQGKAHESHYDAASISVIVNSTV